MKPGTFCGMNTNESINLNSNKAWRQYFRGQCRACFVTIINDFIRNVAALGYDFVSPASKVRGQRVFLT